MEASLVAKSLSNVVLERAVHHLNYFKKLCWNTKCLDSTHLRLFHSLELQSCWEVCASLALRLVYQSLALYQMLPHMFAFSEQTLIMVIVDCRPGLLLDLSLQSTYLCLGNLWCLSWFLSAFFLRNWCNLSWWGSLKTRSQHSWVQFGRSNLLPRNFLDTSRAWRPSLYRGSPCLCQFSFETCV